MELPALVAQHRAGFPAAMARVNGRVTKMRLGWACGFLAASHGEGISMRRLAALLSLAILGACTTVDYDFSDVTTSPTTTTGYPRFADSDPFEWASHKPWNYAVHGTDVSKYQGEVDWAKAKANGISFAFLKATEGGDRVDDYFAQNWRQARAVGIPRGAYHFYYFCRTAEDQARWFIRHVPKDASALPPVLDMEWNHLSPTCKLRPPAAKVRSEMRIFLDMVTRHYGKRPIIYTSIDFFEDNGLSSFRDYPFWLRSVSGHPTEKYGDHPFVFWQYTGTGQVPGIPGDADINVFNGSEGAWRKWLKENAG
jgi:lysozyme